MARVNDRMALFRNDQNLNYLQLLRPETDTSPTALAQLVQGLSTNTSIQRVRAIAPRNFYRENDGSSSEEASLTRRRLFQAVGRLPKLEELKIDAYAGMATFPLEVLAQTIIGTRKLKELELWDLKLTLENVDEDGTSPDLENLNIALRNHPSLEKFTLYNCQLRESSVCTLDPLLRALATIPALKKVYITAAAAVSSASESVSFTRSALEDLCRSPSLQEIGLWKFNFLYSSQQETADPLALLAPAIAETDILRMFEFGKCHLSREGDEALAAMLEVNTSLEELDLHLDSSDSKGGKSVCEIVATAKALQSQNTTLKRLKLWGLLNRSNQEALVRMICDNYSLETCRLLDADRDISAQIDFYIALNRGGRKYFLTSEQPVTTGQWLDLLENSDLGTIFYYLCRKPNLCQLH